MPLTSSDFMFSFNHDWLDPEMQPLTNVAVRGASFVVIDDLTFQIVFPRPNPTFVNYYAFYASRWVDPMHFFKDYHPAYRDRDELNALVKEKGHVTWMAMFNQVAQLGSRGRLEGAHPARLQGGAAHGPPRCGWSATPITSRSIPRATSCRTSTRWT